MFLCMSVEWKDEVCEPRVRHVRDLAGSIGRAMNAGKCLGFSEAGRLCWDSIEVAAEVPGEPVLEDAVSGWWLGKGGRWMPGMRGPREEGSWGTATGVTETRVGRGFCKEAMMPRGDERTGHLFHPGLLSAIHL